jgi:hypothetical protein
MNTNQIQKTLEEYPFLPAEIEKRKNEYVETLKHKQDIIDVLHAILISDMPHGTSTGDPTYKATAAVLIWQTRLDDIAKQISELLAKMKQVENWLELLSPIEKKVVEMRCWAMRPARWRAIAREIHYEESSCRKIFDRALRKLELGKAPHL